MNREQLEKKALELGVDPSLFDTKKKLSDEIKRVQGEVPPSEKVVVEKKGKVKKDTVTLESDDDRSLSCQINNVKYEGKTIEVPVASEKGVREVLTAAGFLLK